MNPEREGTYTNLRKWVVSHGFGVDGVVIRTNYPEEKKTKLEERRVKVNKAKGFMKRKFSGLDNELIGISA
jgi:hypothetical protein